MYHELDLGIWTPKLVGEELVAASKWALHAVRHPGPAGYGSNMPAIALLADDRILEDWPTVDELEPVPMRRHVSPARVSQFERILRWPLEYLDPTNQQTRILQIWTRTKIMKGATFVQVVDHKKWSRATAYRARDKALATIAMGLTSNGIVRGKH